MSTQRGCQLYGVSRQSLYQARQRTARKAERAAHVLVAVRAERTKLPRLGARKLRHKISPRLRAQGMAVGRDALFPLLRQLPCTHNSSCQFPAVI